VVGIVQEVEVASGRVLFEWRSNEHVGVDESFMPQVTPAGNVDYFHLNSIDVDTDGQLLVSARNTSTVYKIDRKTGDVLWRLGGKKSDFTLGENVAFAWQHNAIAVDHHGLIRIFDNEASPAVLPYSRVIWVRHDDEKKTATLERSFKHPESLSAGSQGNAQGLENGDTFVGWGALPRISEFDERGGLVFDASFPAGYNTYRAYRFEWRGEPDTRPTAIATRAANGDTVVRAIWNGATEVVEWDVLESEGHHAHEVQAAAWNGFDTSINVGEYLRSVVVVARDRYGREIGRSAITPVSE